jgi:hypothetical protein
MNQLEWAMLDRDTDLAPQERKSEALAVDPACSVKGIKESKVLLEKNGSPTRGPSVCVVRFSTTFVKYFYTIKITE